MLRLLTFFLYLALKMAVKLWQPGLYPAGRELEEYFSRNSEQPKCNTIKILTLWNFSTKGSGQKLPTVIKSQLSAKKSLVNILY